MLGNHGLSFQFALTIAEPVGELPLRNNKSTGSTLRLGFQPNQISLSDARIVGLKSCTDLAESIKSLDGFKRAWWEEAANGSARSVQLLSPTIRAPDSEIWFGWNPRRKADPVDLLFRSGTPPTGSAIVHANWNNNPWFPSILEQERLDCLNNTPDQYNHVWEGDYATVLSGAYYADCLAKAKLEGRIGNVAADPLMTYRAFWDIGGTGRKSDATSIWIAQFIGREIRVLDYYEAQGQPLAAHVNWLRNNGYSKALCVLPHDGLHGDIIYDVPWLVISSHENPALSKAPL